jgi:hypothetical protein
MREAYRILENVNGRPHTLFHGLAGRRALPLDIVLRADVKPVTNPGKKEGKVFQSGFHVLLSKEECLDYLTRFKANRDLRVVKVYVDATRQKPRSKVTLAEFMEIKSEDWQAAIAP